jgi:hypothetical protein
MTIGFYRNNDDSREIIKSGDFTDLSQAVEFFAAMKGLAVENFLELFTVIPLKRSRDGRF